MGDMETLTQDRAARRFHQIASFESRIQNKLVELADAKAGVKELSDEYEALMKGLRMAARDEGELPLFEGL